MHVSASPTPPPPALAEIAGWFPRLDQILFGWFLERQERSGPPGDLLELGVYVGKSAVLIGRYQHAGETFTVCDLFGTQAPDGANAQETLATYPGLTRAAFERHYLAFHDRLPDIIAGPTTLVPGQVKPGSCRFVHVDASHLYEHVRDDLSTARTVLRPGGIVACDDYRSEHTPGVAAAVWEAVAQRGLHPVCVTPQKLYGTWQEPGPIQEDLLGWLGGRPDCWHEVQDIRGQRLIRLAEPAPPKPPPEVYAELARVGAALERERSARRGSESELADVRGSVSFRLGRVLTAAPRGVRRWVRPARTASGRRTDRPSG
jgi:hypothetical protein